LLIFDRYYWAQVEVISYDEASAKFTVRVPEAN